MKKVIIGLFLLIVVVIGVVSYYVFSNLDALVEAAIEKYGSEATKTSVQVDSVKIKLQEGSAAIYGLTVANPGGFSDPKVFSLGEVSTRINYDSVSKEILIIDDITVLAPQVFFEMNKDKETNLNVLKKNIMSGPSAAPAQKEKSKPAEGQAIKMIIRHMKFAEGDINATVVPLNDKKYKLKLPSLEMTDLGAPNGAPPEVIAKQILNKLTDQAKTAIKKQGIDKEIEKLKAQAQQKIDEEKAKLKGQVDSKVESEVDKAKDKLKGLFGK